MKKIINLTNKYIVTATPLILFTLITSVYLSICVNGGKIINLLISFVLLFLMTAAFLAGWFNMLKIAVEKSDDDDDEPNSLIKSFTPGVGEYFLPCTGAILISIIISLILLTITTVIGMHTIGNPQISADAFSNALKDTESLKQFLSGLSSEQLVKISMWNMLFLGTTYINWFLVMFYMPAMFFESKNPFIAFFKSLKRLFSKKFIKNIGIFLLISCIYFIISILSALFAQNAILTFIITLINFYFICATALGIFYYYNHSFIKTQLGQNVDTYI